MPHEVVANVYANYGLFGLVVISFFIMVWWVIKKYNEREEKFYKVIEVLASQMPDMQKSLERIERKIDTKNT